jgi:cytochrome c oxidase subunit 4
MNEPTRPAPTLHEEHVSLRTYYLIFGALLVLLVLTVAVAYLDLGGWGIALALLIATVKALLVILYFMHVRYSNPLTWLFVASGFAWLVILIGLTFSDYLSRGWIGD